MAYIQGGLDVAMKIVKAKLKNAYDIAYIQVSSWKDAYLGIIPDDYLEKLTVEKKEKFIAKIFDKGIADYYLMYDEARPIGVFVACRSMDKDADGDTAEVSAIYFLPEYWRKGHGTKLLEFGLNKIKELGYRNVTLWVLEKNDKARRFYEKNGFEIDGTKDEIIIGKPLTKVRYKIVLKNS